MHIQDLTISQIKQDLQKKKYSAVELTQSYLERISILEKKINAFVTVCEDIALKQAKQADVFLTSNQTLPLLGIPIAIKDNYCTKNLRTTASSNILKDFIPPYNATVVQKLLDAGCILLGKTNLDAWAHGSSTEASDFGVTKNPWDISKLSGGSSGGSAASVAADESLAAIGTETAGSIRQPASWCGVVGMKPTYGRVSRYGVIAMASSTDSPGPITKCVEDAALILEIIAGNDQYDATSSNFPVSHYSEAIKTKKEQIRIGISQDYFVGVDEEVVKLVEEAVKVLAKMGHGPNELKLMSPEYAIDVYTILQRCEVSSNLARYDGIRYGYGRELFGDEAKRRIMLGTYALSAGYYDAYYKKAQRVRTLLIQDFEKAFSQVDVIIAPSCPTAALPIGSTKDHSMFGEVADMLMEPSSIAGLCGISIPCGYTKKGLPVGMQIIGPQFGEEIIFNLAYQYEKETEWRKYSPKL